MKVCFDFCLPASIFFPIFLSFSISLITLLPFSFFFYRLLLLLFLFGVRAFLSISTPALTCTCAARDHKPGVPSSSEGQYIELLRTFVLVFALGDWQPCVFLGVHRQFAMCSMDVRFLTPRVRGGNVDCTGPVAAHQNWIGSFQIRTHRMLDATWKWYVKDALMTLRPIFMMKPTGPSLWTMLSPFAVLRTYFMTLWTGRIGCAIWTSKWVCSSTYLLSWLAYCGGVCISSSISWQFLPQSFSMTGPVRVIPIFRVPTLFLAYYLSLILEDQVGASGRWHLGISQFDKLVVIYFLFVARDGATGYQCGDSFLRLSSCWALLCYQRYCEVISIATSSSISPNGLLSNIRLRSDVSTLV